MISNRLGEHVGLSHQWHSASASRQLSISYINMFSYLKEAIEARKQFSYKRLEEEDPCCMQCTQCGEDEKKKEEKKNEDEKKEEEKKKDAYAEVYGKH